MSCEKGGEGGQNLPSHTGFQTDFLKPVWTCGTGGSLCPALFLLFNCWFGSAKRERGKLLRPCGIPQPVWKQLEGHKEGWCCAITLCETQRILTITGSCSRGKRRTMLGSFCCGLCWQWLWLLYSDTVNMWVYPTSRGCRQTLSPPPLLPS